VTVTAMLRESFRSAVPLSLQRSFSNCNPCLAGHNKVRPNYQLLVWSDAVKWSKIKQKKGIMDAQKGAIYGRITRV
jgi:translational activator of cytochrome c oxidase 1